MSLNILPDQNELGDMLRYTRPYKSQAERSFINKFIAPLGVHHDKLGNYWKYIPGGPGIIWSSHTDTVHGVSGRQSVHMRQYYDSGSGVYGKSKLVASSDGTCLGADCTTGVFIMMNMIRNEVPGLYLFHAGEERGCIGSKAIADNNPDVLKKYKTAIAFDRKGYGDIVEYQRGQRCCSKEFVASLAKILGGSYKASSGIWTDTAEYTDYIGECTNISVGYFNQHTANECQDIDFVLGLVKTLCEADFSSLVYMRKPGEKQSEYSCYGSGNNWHGNGGYYYREPTTIYNLVDRHTWEVAKFLEEQGVTFEELKRYVDAKKASYKAVTKYCKEYDV